VRHLCSEGLSPRGHPPFPSLGFVDYLGGELFELGDELPETFGVVEQGAITLELSGAEGASHGLGTDLADPSRVGAVELTGVAMTTTGGGAAAGRACHQAARQAEAELGDLGSDLTLAALGLLFC